MRIDRDRRTHTALAALTLAGASVFLTPAGALAQAAGADTGVAATSGSAVERARALADKGRLVEARGVLDAFSRTDGLGAMSASDRAGVLELIKSIDSRIQTADPLEISLQKAEAALGEGDLVMAERQAKAVTAKATTAKGQRERAEGVLAQIATRRAELRPTIDGLVEQARQDYAAKRYAEAKTAITAVLRSGVELSADRATELERARLEIVEIEQQRGQAFGAAGAGMTMMQAGHVRRGGEPGRAEPLPGSVEPAGAPTTAPSGEPLAQGPGADAPPPAGQPSGQPAGQPSGQPSGQPAGDQPGMTAPPAGGTSGSDADIVTQAMRAEAARIVAEGDRAFDGALYSRAIEQYTLALAQFRQYLSQTEADRVQRRIEDARARLGSGGSGADIAQNAQATSIIIRQRAQAQFTNYMSQARAALQVGNVQNAQDAVASAKLSVSQARGEFNDAENAQFENLLTQLRADITAKQEQILREEAEKKTRQAAATASETEKSRLADRDRRVNENIDRIRALQQERKYDEALQVCDQTLFIDPNNATALLLRDILRDISIYVRYNQAQADKEYNHARLGIDNSRATVPPLGLMEYPSNWPAKTFERGELAAYAETPENRKVLAQITSPASRVPVDFNDNSFEDVVKFLATVTNLNFDADWESLATVGVERGTRVTLKLQPVTVQTALDRLMAKVSRDQFGTGGAAWAVKDGMVVIGSDEALRRDRTLVIYNIQDLLFTIPNYRQVPSIDLNSVLQQSQGGSGTSPFQNANDQQQQEDPAARERRIRQIVDIIQANVDPTGWKDTGGETGALQELNGSLIITNTPRNHREIVGLLSKLREIRNMQINVETKFLLVNQQWFEQIGFDLDIIWNAGSGQINNARRNNILPSSFFNFSPGTNTPQGVLPNATTGTAPNNVRQLNADKLSPIATSQGSLGLTTALSEGDFASAVLTRAPALGIAGQFLDDVQVDFLIQATQADKRSVRLTAPRLTFTNGQTANIYVVTQQAFVSGLNPIVGDSAVGFNPTVSVLSEGVTLLVEGVISSDRRYVTLNVDTGVARLDRLRQSSVSAVAGGQLVNSANTQSFIELPQITVTRVRTTATVPDEGTILLGGQRLITEVEVETGVPVLSKIPIINRFFTNRLETKEEQTLLILIKPTVLIQTEEEERAFPGVTDQYRSGMGIR